MFICSTLQFICCFCRVDYFGAWPLPVLPIKIFIITNRKQLKMNKLGSSLVLCECFSVVLKGCCTKHQHLFIYLFIFTNFLNETITAGSWRKKKKKKSMIVAVPGGSVWQQWCFGCNPVGSDFFHQPLHHLLSLEALMTFVLFALVIKTQICGTPDSDMLYLSLVVKWHLSNDLCSV